MLIDIPNELLSPPHESLELNKCGYIEEENDENTEGLRRIILKCLMKHC